MGRARARRAGGGAIAEAAGRCDRAVIAIGNNAARKALAEKLGLEWTTVMHPRAYVHESVSLGAVAVVMAGVVLQPGCVVGRHAIINTGALIDHDCTIGDFVHAHPDAEADDRDEVDAEDAQSRAVNTATAKRRRRGP